MPTLELFSASSIGFDPRSAIPSMLSNDEKALYYDVARRYTGLGAVVEIGSWLGSGTIQICRGLEESREQWDLTVIDRFRWSDVYSDRYPAIGLKGGDSFLHLFRENLGDYADRIRCIETELQDLPNAYAQRPTIELLFVDAPKSWSMLWTVLDLLGPSLMTGASVVFQDFLHITSRQLIWLLASIPQLRPVRLVEDGTAAVFRVEAPIPGLAGQVPRNMSRLGVEDLLRLWQGALAALPASRAGELSAGMALDLLHIGATDAAVQVLDRAKDEETTPALLAELDRLIRYSDKQVRRALTQSAAYLRAGITPAAAQATWQAQAEQDAALSATPDQGPLGPLSSERVAALATSLRRPTTGKELAVRHAVHRDVAPADLQRLLPVFEAAARSGAALQARDVAELAVGRRVVELGAGITLHGVALIALGAQAYAGISEGYDPAHRTYTSAIPTIRHRTTIPVGEVVQLLPGFSFAASAADLPDAGAELVIIDGRRSGEALLAALDEAARLVTPGGTVCVRWRNPYSWAGHGRAPQRVAEIDRNDTGQAEVLDWRHLRRLRIAPPTLREVREVLEMRMTIEAWTPRADDPAAALRLRQKIMDANPMLTVADLTTASVLVTGRILAKAGKGG